MERWAQHRAADNADEVDKWGCLVIERLASGDPNSKDSWLAAGAEGVLRCIAAKDTTEKARLRARSALTHGLDLQA